MVAIQELCKSGCHEGPTGPRKLKEALELNQPWPPYYMKEDPRQLWSHPDKATARAFLSGWVAKARGSGIAMLIRFANTAVIAYYDYPILEAP